MIPLFYIIAILILNFVLAVMAKDVAWLNFFYGFLLLFL